MAAGAGGHKLNHLLTSGVARFRPVRKGLLAMVPLALGCFLGVFLFGGQLLGWYDPDGHIKLGLFMVFIFGIICGYRAR
jgi:hypothetical protein